MSTHTRNIPSSHIQKILKYVRNSRNNYRVHESRVSGSNWNRNWNNNTILVYVVVDLTQNMFLNIFKLISELFSQSRNKTYPLRFFLFLYFSNAKVLIEYMK